jgi:XRE family transcriptional regulator, regulator of sulfur utilization
VARAGETQGVSAIAVKFGRVVRSLRERRGLSQEALSSLAGLSRGFLGEIERGDSVPSIETLQKLADALGEKLSYLVSLYEQLED